MITTRQAAALERRISALVEAVYDDAFKGAGDPLDIEAIEKDLRDARRSLRNYIEKLKGSK